MKIKRGSTSVRRLIFVADSTSTTGAGLTSLVHNSSGLTAYYFAGDLSNEVQITLASATLGSYTSGGWVAVDNTNMPGWYEVGIPDAALDGGNEVAIQYRGATNMVPVNIYIELDAVDYQSATNFGLSKFADIETDTQDIQSRLPAALVSGRIDASVGAMAANTLTASALASDAVDEIVNAVFAYQVTQDQFEILLQNMSAGVIAIETDTQDIQSRLPAALVSGRINASVGAMAADTITASALAADAAGEIADAVWDEPYSQHTTAGTFGKVIDILRKANTVIDGTVTATVSPTTTSFSSNVNYPTGAFKHSVLLFLTGSLAEQNSPILTYVNTNGVITVEEAFTSAPQTGNEFIIIPTTHVHAIAAIQAGLATSTGVTSAFTEIKGAGWSSATDTLEGIRDAVDAGAGGGASVNILPASVYAPKRGSETVLEIYIGETIQQSLTVYQSDGTTPLSLAGKTLEVVFDKFDGTDVVVVSNSSITVSGANNNVATFAYPSAATESIGIRFWALRDASAPKTVYAFGQLKVLQTAFNDP